MRHFKEEKQRKLCHTSSNKLNTLEKTQVCDRVQSVLIAYSVGGAYDGQMHAFCCKTLCP